MAEASDIDGVVAALVATEVGVRTVIPEAVSLEETYLKRVGGDAHAWPGHHDPQGSHRVIWPPPLFRRVWAGGLLMGVLRPLGLADTHGPLASNPTTLFQAVGVRLTAVVRAAQTAPDLVLQQRVGRTRDYLFTTPIPDAALLAAQLVGVAASGCAAALLATPTSWRRALITHTAWHWLYLGTPIGRLAAFALSVALCVYLAVVAPSWRSGQGSSASPTWPPCCLWAPSSLLCLGVAHPHADRGPDELGGAGVWAVMVVLALVRLRLLWRERVVLYLQE